jgi:hypothetical protein
VAGEANQEAIIPAVEATTEGEGVVVAAEAVAEDVGGEAVASSKGEQVLKSERKEKMVTIITELALEDRNASRGAETIISDLVLSVSFDTRLASRGLFSTLECTKRFAVSYSR